jgi:hypothetical protein
MTMKGLKTVLVPAVAAAIGLAFVTDVEAQHSGGATRASSGGARVGGSWSGGPRAAASGGWHHNGGSHGSWSGRHWSGGGSHWRGGHYGHSHWHGWGLWGVPVLWGAAVYGWGWPYYGYYGYPYYYDYYPVYPAYPAAPVNPSGELGPPAEVVPGPGAPTQGPLYMNYCESAKAYYPKVTSCPEGWKFLRPNA